MSKALTSLLLVLLPTVVLAATPAGFNYAGIYEHPSVLAAAVTEVPEPAEMAQARTNIATSDFYIPSVRKLIFGDNSPDDVFIQKTAPNTINITGNMSCTGPTCGGSAEVGRIESGTSFTVGTITGQATGSGLPGDCSLQQIIATNTGGGGVTVTLPTATSLGNASCGVILVNQTNPLATVKVCANTGAAPCASTPAGWNINTQSGSSNELDLTTANQKVTITVDPSGGAWRAVPSGGGVSSVGLTVNAAGSSGNFSVTNSPVNGSGNLNLNLTGTAGGVECFLAGGIPASSGVLSSGDAITGGGVSGCPQDAGFPPTLGVEASTIGYVCPAAQTTCEYNGDKGTTAAPSDANDCVTPGTPCATDAGLLNRINPTTTMLRNVLRVQHADTTGPNVAVANTCYQPNQLEIAFGTVGAVDQEIFAAGIIAQGNYPVAYVDIAGVLQPTLMGTGANGFETQFGTVSTNGTTTVTWVSGFMSAFTSPTNQFQTGLNLNGVQININGSNFTIASVAANGLSLTTTVATGNNGTVNATLGQRYFAGDVMPNNAVYPNGLVHIPAGSVVLDASATDYLYWPGSGTVLLVTTTLATANAAGNALIGTITTNANRVATAYTPNLAVLMTGASTCTGTTASNYGGFKFVNTNARIRGITPNYFDPTLTFGFPGNGFVVGYGGSTDIYAENLNSTMTGNQSAHIVTVTNGARAHFGGNMQATNTQIFFASIFASGDTNTPIGTNAGYLSATVEAGTNTYAGVIWGTNEFSHFIVWGPTAMNFLGTSAYHAFQSQSAASMQTVSAANLSSTYIYNNSAMTIFVVAQFSFMYGPCGGTSNYCAFTSFAKHTQAQDGSYFAQVTNNQGSSPDTATGGSAVVYNGNQVNSTYAGVYSLQYNAGNPFLALNDLTAADYFTAPTLGAFLVQGRDPFQSYSLGTFSRWDQSVFSNANATDAPQFLGYRSRGPTANAHGAVQSADQLYQLAAVGDDGTLARTGGQILAEADGTWDTTHWPLRWRFLTRPNSNGALVEALRIDSSQRTILGGTLESLPNPQSIGSTTTVTLDMTKGNVQQVACTGVGAFTLTLSPTNLLKGETLTFIFVQNGTSACTVSYPATMHGGTAPSATLSSINVQEFIVSNNGTDLYAKGAGTQGMTGGTP